MSEQSKIDEIKEVLSKCTQGNWEWKEKERSNYGGDLGAIYSGVVEVCNFGNDITYYPTEGTEPSFYDQQVMVNAPQWISYLIEQLEQAQHENERLKEISAKDTEVIISYALEHQKLIEALEYYADENRYFDAESNKYAEIHNDNGQKARDILKEVQHGTSKET